MGREVEGYGISGWGSFSVTPPPQKTELSKNLSGFINVHPKVQ